MNTRSKVVALATALLVAVLAAGCDQQISPTAPPIPDTQSSGSIGPTVDPAQEIGNCRGTEYTEDSRGWCHPAE
jgi:hypothetical protein